MRLRDVVEGLPSTQLLYFTDSYLQKFNGNVLKVVLERKKDVYVVLDKTIFHPKGGGQPTDRGVLFNQDYRIHVRKTMYVRGVVVHSGKLLQGAISEEEHISGEIDWSRRYRFMKRHTAGHLLDHCLTIYTNQPVETTDSWLEDPCYVGYRGTPPASSIATDAEQLANAMIGEGRPVTIETVDKTELTRRAPHAPNIYRLPNLPAYRIVTIQGCTPIPCAGTHLKSLNEIGRVTIMNIEERESGYRVYYDVSKT